LVNLQQVTSQSIKFIREDFFKRLEEVLVKNIGPVASYIIDDVLSDLNTERSLVNGENAALLTEAISHQIADEDKRLKFQQDMLEYIKQL
jgi:hypothetical protein